MISLGTVFSTLSDREDLKGFVLGFAIYGEGDSLPEYLVKHSIRDA